MTGSLPPDDRTVTDQADTDDFHGVEDIPVRYAFIGEAIGLTLIYLGTRITYRIVSWPLIGLGISFLLVMTAYVISVAWRKTSPSAHRFVSRLRGHVRRDPELGTLIRNKKAECWEGGFTAGDRAIDLVIDGHAEPDARLVARARELVKEFQALQLRLDDYLAQEATREEDPEFADEIRQLRVSAINLRSPKRPALAVIDFDGPDDGRFWYCEYVNGTLRDLRFDN
jgi:hypothetical protein